MLRHRLGHVLWHVTDQHAASGARRDVNVIIAHKRVLHQPQVGCSLQKFLPIPGATHIDDHLYILELGQPRLLGGGMRRCVDVGDLL